MSKSSDSDISWSDRPWIQQFEHLCSSEDLSLDKLQRMTEGVSLDDLHNSSFLHRLCFNNNITLEMVKYLLDLYPEAINSSISLPEAEIFSAFPLHMACRNYECPNEVIQLLLQKEHLYQLTFMSYMGFNWDNTGIIIHHGNTRAHGGLPLHYYLSRPSNVDLNIVKQLVTTNIGVLLLADENTKCTPIHILMNNKSIGDLFDVMKYLVETNPSSLLAKDEHDQTPLAVACKNKSITAGTIRFLLEACPSSIHQRNNCNELPIHSLCEVNTDGGVAIEILKLLLKAHPDSVTQTDGEGYLPLHLAAMNKSPAFCKILVDAYPELAKRVDDDGDLPIHNACHRGRPDTVEYLFELYPESLHIRNNNGYLPIHEACGHPNKNTAEIVKFLLLHDPDCLSKPVVSDFNSDDEGSLPLHLIWSESWGMDEFNMTELLFDLYPEAILIRNRLGQLPIDIIREDLDQLTGSNDIDCEQRLQELIRFLSTQMNYARQAQDQNAMRMPDRFGFLPLHNAIRDGAPLGAIKLLIKGNPNAINIPDGYGVHPLGIACYSGSVGVVKYLTQLVPDRLNAYDMNKNFPLHHACRGGNCEVIEYLLETPISSAPVSERNSDGMLPIHLFCEFVKGRRGCEGETPEYTETIWRLLTAYPETVLNW